MENRIIAFDAGENGGVACVFNAEPPRSCEARRRAFVKTKFHNLETNKEGFKKLLKLVPNVFVVEPTGMHYIRPWLDLCWEHNVEVHIVHNSELETYRYKGCGWEEKDDPHDAFALGCYYYDYRNKPIGFRAIKDPETYQLRDMILRLNALAKDCTMRRNRITSYLAQYFPEQKDRRNCGAKGNPPPFYAWIADRSDCSKVQRTKLDKLYRDSVAFNPQGFPYFLQRQADQLCEMEIDQFVFLWELEQLLNHPRYRRYQASFDELGMGNRIRATLLSQFYPFETFLTPDGKEIVDRIRYFNAKLTKHYIGRNRFMACLGMGCKSRSSGKKDGKVKKTGSALCKNVLWLWVFSRIETNTGASLQNEHGKKLRDFFQSEKKELSDDVGEIFTTIQEIRSEAQEIGSKKILDLLEKLHDNLPRKLKRIDLNKVTKAKVKELLLPLARERTAALGVKMLYRLLLAEFKR
ncbi:MAG: IS110 family transposase [Oscillatoria sp. SIO1A7]|nr:IS110 family transposase [Oscillatoria sp. SIO1A7]